MTEPRRERADAARNRRAILAATEALLAEHRAGDVSMEDIAAAAGVSKGTVFHRFGSRSGLMVALMIERAEAFNAAMVSAAPPLGPGAPAADRLIAFLDGVIDLIARNKSLTAELAGRQMEPRNEQEHRSLYADWHAHLAALLAAARPDADADVLGHLLLGALQSEPVLRLLAADGEARVRAALRALIGPENGLPSPG